MSPNVLPYVGRLLKEEELLTERSLGSVYDLAAVNDLFRF